MSKLKDLEHILRAYTQKKDVSTISRYNLERYAANWAGEFQKTRPGFTPFGQMAPAEFDSLLEEAEAEGICALIADEQNAQQVVYLKYFPHIIRKIYEEAKQTPESSFPNEDMLGETIPDAAVEVIEVKEHFVPLLKNLKGKNSTVFRLIFPEGIRSMIIIGELIHSQLLSMCVLKLRAYLALQKNSDYVINKIHGIFPHKEQPVKDLFSNIMTQREVAITTIADPDDFTFQFWTHLSTFVVNEFREKANKLDREHGFSQACYLIGLFALHYKGLKKQKLEKEQALRHVQQGIKKPPYFYSFSDIYGMRDKVGTPISKRISQQELAHYLERKTTREKNGPLTDIVRLMSADKNEYYVSKERLLNLVLQRAQAFSRQVRAQYVKEWAEVLGDYKKLSMMNRRDLFQNDIWNRIMDQDPLLARLLQYELLFICLNETKPSKEVYIEANRIIDEKQQRLIPVDEILRLDPKRIIRDARTYLPLWKSIPVIGRIGVVLGKLWKKLVKGAESIKDPSDLYASFTKSHESRGRPPMGGGDTFDNEHAVKNASPSPGAKQFGARDGGHGGEAGDREVSNQVAFKKALYELKRSYIGTKGNIDQSLDELIEEWNPLVEGKAKKDLVEDVNSAVRDFLRRIKRSLMVTPPDEQRIHNLSKQIAEYEAFKRIKRKEPFRRYIELYMIKLLSNR
ncbi:MAG: hypothetical protein K9L66_07650 [Spirochaetaceae bacterium]|nr:hypothetical protein [Spirochaetaceae bacterium]MCF7949432.1 hypothetical protein [Spirochaetia bacterium]MCF7951367.1 hypothetical protein [Spirochaetaceae bacterium]